jgi:hypothetical protein
MNSKRKLHDAAPPAWPLELQSEWHDAIEELHQESDRAVALLGAAYVDTALKSLFKASLAGGKVVANKLFEKNAPLASFRRASQWLTVLVTLVQTISMR